MLNKPFNTYLFSSYPFIADNDGCKLTLYIYLELVAIKCIETSGAAAKLLTRLKQ